MYKRFGNLTWAFPLLAGTLLLAGRVWRTRSQGHGRWKTEEAWKVMLTIHLAGLPSRLIHTFILTLGTVCPTVRTLVFLLTKPHTRTRRYTPILLTSKTLPLAIWSNLKRAWSGWAALCTIIKPDFTVHLSGNYAQTPHNMTANLSISLLSSIWEIVKPGSEGICIVGTGRCAWPLEIFAQLIWLRWCEPTRHIHYMPDLIL